MAGVESVNEVPKYGLKVNLEHKYPLNWRQERVPRWHQIWNFLPLAIRYFLYWIKIKWQGRRVVMDYIHLENSKQIYGVPIGGIGSGTIGRGFKGEFCRYQLRPGLYDYETVDANQFFITIRQKDGTTIFQSLLSTFKKTNKHLQSWKSNLNGQKCKYTGLYPRSWTEYDLKEYGIELVCRQISPIIPHNYSDSCIPCAVFVWTIKNCSDQELSVTIAFTFKNGIGVKKVDEQSTCSSKPFSYLSSEGAILYHTIDKMACSYSLAIKKRDGIDITKCLHFDPNSDGKVLWNQLYQKGGFEKVTEKKHYPNIFGEMGVAVAANCTLSPNNCKDVEFSLVWDMPTVQFFDRKQKYNKYYTTVFGMDSALKIVDYSLNNFKRWEEEIYSWQKPVLSDSKLPDWFKGALFNETYFISDGGTVWFALDEKEIAKLPPEDPRAKYGRFAYLEGHEYRMYNTYDVHFYASIALAMNWPGLQLSLQYDYKDAVFTEMSEEFRELYSGHLAKRKVPNSVPHDLGDPSEEPFSLLNAYPTHDVSLWRDLNSKFVLQVFRDYCLIDDTVHSRKLYLEDMFEALTKVMKKTEGFDEDHDGLIENSGAPDQTYDSWTMFGPGAYCGGLWLGALWAMVEICSKLEKPQEESHYREILQKGAKSFNEKLWNGEYYKFDSKERPEGDICMADQLCGFWSLATSGYLDTPLFPKERVLSALKSIYDKNVMSCCDGEMGAINGFTSKGLVDESTVQSEEIWIGVVYALASTMLFMNMDKEAWQTAGKMGIFLTEKLGLTFETPEALYRKDNYRAIGYMRPLSIWSMYLAWKKQNNQQ